MSTSRASRVWTIVAFVVSLVTISFAVWLFLNRQFALDQMTVWGYQPSSSIKELDEKVQFTDKGIFAFYATKPVVASPQEFNDKCPRQEAGSAILGCYTSDDRIYVFDVTNEQLDGIKEVTAAHEMLHAVWQRMSGSERDKISGLLKETYEKGASEELRERMAYYQRTEPGEFSNELHSIVGTEMASLSPELETYYAQYFKNRQLIVDQHAKYSGVYQALYTRANELVQNMDTLAKGIETRSTAYEANVSQLSADIASFNSRANGGSFSSVAQFNSERAALLNRSTQLERDRASINSDIESYNALYGEYQTIASQIELLNNSIDSFKVLEESPKV